MERVKEESGFVDLFSLASVIEGNKQDEEYNSWLVISKQNM